MIKIESELSRENVPVTEESVTNYMLVKLLPAISEEASSLPLNLSLVIDNSGSMYGSDQRIAHAIDAACHVVDMLDSRDIVSVVAFHDHAQVFQNSSAAQGKESIKQAIRSITSWQSGGTRMVTGMESACNELKRNLSSDRVNRVFLLTDGLTETPQECEYLAEQETRKGIVFSTFGVGNEWNQPLLAKIADLGRGRWYYIETPAAIPSVFRQELAALQKAYLNNVELIVDLKRGITVKRVRQLEPEIADVISREISEQEVVIEVKTMQRDTPVFMLFQLSLGARQPGQYRILDLFAMYDIPGRAGQRARTPPLSVMVTYTTDPEQLWQNGDVLRYVDMEHIDAMVRKGTLLAEQGQKGRATKLLAAASQVADRAGDKKKTRLIQEALQELGTAGRIDRRTQLAMADRARKTKLMPEEEVED